MPLIISALFIIAALSLVILVGSYAMGHITRMIENDLSYGSPPTSKI